MAIWIEFAGLLILIIIFILWAFYKKITDYFIARKYDPSKDISKPMGSWWNKHKIDSINPNNKNPNDNKSRIGKGERREDKGADAKVGTYPESTDDVPEPSTASERTIVQDGSDREVGKDSNSNGTTSSPSRKFFGRFRSK